MPANSGRHNRQKSDRSPLIQDEKEGKRDPRKPQRIGDDRVLAEWDQIIQPTVNPQIGGLDRALQQGEEG